MTEVETMQAAILDLLQRVQRLEAEAADRRLARALSEMGSVPAKKYPQTDHRRAVHGHAV